MQADRYQAEAVAAFHGLQCAWYNAHTNTVLSDEQAFDVAAYINSQSRPVKPHLEVDFPARKNKPVDAAFHPFTPGFSAEQHKYGPWQPIQEAREKVVYPPK